MTFDPWAFSGWRDEWILVPSEKRNHNFYFARKAKSEADCADLNLSACAGWLGNRQHGRHRWAAAAKP